MKKIEINIQDSIFSKFLWLLGHFSSDEIQIDTKLDYEIALKEDKEAYNIAMNDFGKGNIDTLEQLKKKINV